MGFWDWLFGQRREKDAETITAERPPGSGGPERAAVSAWPQDAPEGTLFTFDDATQDPRPFFGVCVEIARTHCAGSGVRIGLFAGESGPVVGIMGPAGSALAFRAAFFQHQGKLLEATGKPLAQVRPSGYVTNVADKGNVLGDDRRYRALRDAIGHGSLRLVESEEAPAGRPPSAPASPAPSVTAAAPAVPAAPDPLAALPAPLREALDGIRGLDHEHSARLASGQPTRDDVWGLARDGRTAELVRILGQPSAAQVHGLIAERLAELGHVAAAPAIHAAGLDAAPGKRTDFGHALAQLGRPEAAFYLAEAIEGVDAWSDTATRLKAKLLALPRAEAEAVLLEAGDGGGSTAGVERALDILGSHRLLPAIEARLAAAAAGSDDERYALLALGERRPPVTERLASLLDARRQSRERVIDALGRTGDPRAAERLLGLWGEASLRFELAVAFGRLKATSAAPLLVEELRASIRDGGHTWDLYRALAAIPGATLPEDLALAVARVGVGRWREADDRMDFRGKEAVEAEMGAGLLDAGLTALLADDDAKTRRIAAGALAGAIDSLGIAGGDPDAIARRAELMARRPGGGLDAAQALAARLEVETDSHLRYCLGYAIEKLAHPGVRDACERILRDRSRGERGILASYLGCVGDRASVPALIEALADPDAKVRDAAASALGSLGDTAAVPGLRQALADPVDDVCAGAALALGKLGAREAVPDLLRLLRERPAKEQALVSALGALAGEDSADVLGGIAAGGRDVFAAASAAAALIRIDTVRTHEWLARAWLGSPHPQVKGPAERHLRARYLGGERVAGR
ncbi:HEAT repeat domain-containing protein [Myxococcota bacterium]|nr:HEAT repeat domain-containing protein [Myxococcota bacterium]